MSVQEKEQRKTSPLKTQNRIKTEQINNNLLNQVVWKIEKFRCYQMLN